MGSDSGVFVKKFGDKEKLKELMGSADWQKAVSRAQYQRNLCLKAGINAMIFDGEFAAKHDPGQVFPSFKQDSEEYRIWMGPFLRGYYNAQWVLWPNMPQDQDGDKWREIPLEVIEEIVPLLESGFFEKIVFFYRFYSGSAMLAGFANGKYYPIVFWGNEDVYREVEQKLEKLEESRRKKEEVVVQKKSETNNKSPVIFFAAVVFIAAVAAMSLLDKTPLPKISETTAAKTTAPVECINCTWSERKPCNSVCDLPVGKVLDKVVYNCENRKEHCVLYFKEKDKVFYKLITKDVFEKVKLGDEIPFQRPEY